MSFELNKLNSTRTADDSTLSNEESKPVRFGASFDECEVEDSSKEQSFSDSENNAAELSDSIRNLASLEMNCVCNLCGKSFFSLDEGESMCYRCKSANNHHYLQRHRCVRSLCRICKKVEERKRMNQVLEQQSELQRKREQSQKSMFEDARVKMLEDLKHT
mmetsp:Transcript_24010/g.27672  ORF Transcript_24010/g.27672 Transcript_24010/m.27672 type:complete len:161 (+) Transcript_24010:460-942(+)